MNIWSDVVCAAGLFALAFPDIPEARNWIELAANELNWQFDRVVWDEIRSPYQSQWLLHTTATTFEWSKHLVRCTTRWGVTLDLHSIWPTTPLVPGTRQGRFGDWLPPQDENITQLASQPFYFQQYFGIPNQANKDFLVVLHPLKSGQIPLEIKDLGCPGKPSLEIRNFNQTDRVELLPDAAILSRKGFINGRWEIKGTKPFVEPTISIGGTNATIPPSPIKGAP